MEAISSAAGLPDPAAAKPEIFYPPRSAVLSPLSFGRVNDGRPVTSQTLLFRLPIELAQEVVAYLDTADLRSLALVDRDCRQLARSRLFTSVTLEYNDEKLALLDKLSHHEAQSRRDNGGVTEIPSIGACIRRLTVAKLSSRRHFYYTDGGILVSDEEIHEIHNASCNYCGIYLPKIAQALRYSLPNLDEFIWRDGEGIPTGVGIPQYMLSAIASSPIRHLGLGDVMLCLDCEYQLPPPEKQRWALRSLDLGAVSYRGEFRDWDRDVSKFYLTILQAAAPTLEKLWWREYRRTKLFFGTSAIRFPRLRTLSLDSLHAPDGAVLDEFFPSDAEYCVPRSLSIKALCDDKNFMAQSMHIQGLESLRLHAISRRDPKPADVVFLSANPQLKSLTLCRYTPEQLTTWLLPLLASDFRFLTTLVVYFTPSLVDTPDSPLTAIGRLSSLTSLWIVASKHHQWAADVHQTITALSPLRNLTRLALSREFHPVASSKLGIDGYKMRARNIVELYVKAFRGLRWVCFEHLVHKVVGNSVVLEEGLSYYSPEVVWESPDWCRQ